MGKPATSKQIAFIESLALKRDLTNAPSLVTDLLAKMSGTQGIDVGEASALIESLAIMPAKMVKHKAKHFSAPLKADAVVPLVVEDFTALVVDSAGPSKKKGAPPGFWNKPEVTEVLDQVVKGQVNVFQAHAMVNALLPDSVTVAVPIVRVRVKMWRDKKVYYTPGGYKRAAKSTSGVEVLVPDGFVVVGQSEIDWAGFFGMESMERFDLRVICSMFYAAERLTTAKKTSPELYDLRQAAQRYITTWADRFARYTLAACLGEFRHRKRKGTVQLVPMDRRHEARAAAQKATEHLYKDPASARRAAEYMAGTFGDPAFFPGGAYGAYGGHKWAKIAKTLLLYYDNKLPAAVWADYVWDLSHNGGRFFDKCSLFQHESHVRALLDQKRASKELDVTSWAGEWLHPKWKKGLDVLEAVNWEGGD